MLALIKANQSIPASLHEKHSMRAAQSLQSHPVVTETRSPTMQAHREEQDCAIGMQVCRKIFFKNIHGPWSDGGHLRHHTHPEK